VPVFNTGGELQNDFVIKTCSGKAIYNASELVIHSLSNDLISEGHTDVA